MDKRLEFTPEQREIIDRYNAIVEEMLNNNIICVHQSYANIYAFNGANVADLEFPENYIGDGQDELVCFDELEQINSPFGMCYLEEDSEMCVTFNEEEGGEE